MSKVHKKIVIDARFWSESGIGRYLRNLIKNLQRIDQSSEYFILLLKKDFGNVNFQNHNFRKVLADCKWYGIDEQIKLPGLIKKLNPDIVHFPHFNVPIFYKGRYIVTIHDLIHQHYQTREATTKNSLVYKIKKAGYKTVFSQAIKNAISIITPSEFVKKQLEDEWGIAVSKVTVTHEGVDEEIINEISSIKEKDFESISQKFNFKKPYLFYIGNAQPHKNIKRLLEVFNVIRGKNPDLYLVLSGPEHSFWDRVKKELGGLENKGVVVTGFVSEKELAVLYKNALAYIQPSLEEGFGIPILEAMASSCPVVASNTASLPEVGSDAALYFNPLDNKDMVEQITRVIDDDSLKQELVQKGEKRYKEFSWQDLAEKTLKIYKQP